MSFWAKYEISYSILEKIHCVLLSFIHSPVKNIHFTLLLTNWTKKSCIFVEVSVPNVIAYFCIFRSNNWGRYINEGIHEDQLISFNLSNLHVPYLAYTKLRNNAPNTIHHVLKSDSFKHLTHSEWPDVLEIFGTVQRGIVVPFY